MNGQLLEQRLLVPVQEVVAPFDEPLQRGAGRVRGRAVTQERRAPLEDGDELRETEHVHARGGELDRQRQSVDAPDDLGSELDGLGVRLESRSCRARTFEEKLHGRGLERRHGDSHLARDVERFAARRQDTRLGTLREQRRGDPRRLVEHVLARVENEESRCVAKPGSHARERIGAANVDGVCEQTDGVVRAARAREVDEPDAVRELALEGTRGLDSESALADAGRAGERHEAVLVQNARDLRELFLAADERGRRRGEIAAAPADGRDGGDRRVVREDRLLQPPELRPRLEPKLVGKHAPGLLERLERIGLATAAVERQHQLPPEPLPERVVRERRTERRRQLAMLAEGEPDLEVLLERVDVQHLEPACLGAEPRGAGQPLQRRPAPEGKRRGDRVRRGRNVAGPQRGAGLREQLLEPHGIDDRVLERVAVGRADDRLLSQRGPEPGDVVMERVPRRGRKLLAPEAVDERVDVDHAAVPEREHRQQRLTLRAAHVRGRPARDNLERAEQPDLEWLAHRRWSNTEESRRLEPAGEPPRLRAVNMG